MEQHSAVLPPLKRGYRFSFGPRTSQQIVNEEPVAVIFDQSVLTRPKKRQIMKKEQQLQPGHESLPGHGRKAVNIEDIDSEGGNGNGNENGNANKNQGAYDFEPAAGDGEPPLPGDLSPERLGEYLRDHAVSWPSLQRHLASSPLSLGQSLDLLTFLFKEPTPGNPSVVSLLSTFLVVGLIRETLLPHLLGLSSSPDRSLLSCLFLIASQKPLLLTQGIILPLLCSPKNKARLVQLDLVHRLVKDGLSGEDGVEVLLQFLRTEAAVSQGLAPPFFGSLSSFTEAGFSVPEWGEELLELFLVVANAKSPAPTELWSLLVLSLDHSPRDLLSSKKLGTLLFSLATKRSSEIATDGQLWKSLVEKTDTFMKKPTLTALSKVLAK